MSYIDNMDSKMSESEFLDTINLILKNFIDTFLKDNKMNRLHIEVRNGGTVELGLKNDDELLVAEFYAYIENRYRKLYVTSTIRPAAVKEIRVMMDFIEEVGSIISHTYFYGPIAIKEICAKDITSQILVRAEKHNNAHKEEVYLKNRVPHKLNGFTISKLTNTIVDMIADNDIVQLQFKTTNSYIQQEFHINMYLEKMVAISGIEVIHFHVVRNVDNKVVVLSDKCVDSVYSTSQYESIKDNLSNPDLREQFADIVKKFIEEVVAFINKVGDKGTPKKYALFTFKEEN